MSRVLRGAVLVAALGAAACGNVMSPLRKLAEVGKEPYLFFVAESGDGMTDLFVGRPDGREVRPATYTSVFETAPSLSPDGGMVAFLRSTDTLAATHREVWVMNLITGAERQLPMPATAVPITKVAWAADGSAIYLKAGSTMLQATPPPGESTVVPVAADKSAAADSSMHVYVGEPAFASVAPCADPADLCVLTSSGEQVLARGAGAIGGIRWGRDSVGYMVRDTLLVRPVGPGRERRVPLVPAVKHAQEFTFFVGTLRR